MFPSGKGHLKIALIYPSVTKDILYKSNLSFKPTEEWELYFLSRNYDYQMLDDNDMDEIGSDVDVAVIPSMEAVSDDMLDEIKQLLDEGKGILLTGNFAEFDEKGNRRTAGDGDLKGFHITKVSLDGKLSVNHFLQGSTPFSEGLKPGQKILLSGNPALFSASGLSDNAHPEGAYLLAEDNYPGIVSGSILNGRLLWFGFSLSQLIDKNKDLLLFNSFGWLASKPDAFINYLPGNSAFSVILYKNVEGSSGLDTAEGDQSTKGKINYFISPSLLDKFHGQLKKNSDSGSINILWDDFLLSQMNPDEKTSWLKRMRRELNEISGQGYYGVSTFGEFKDPDTYKKLAETGYSFIFSSGYAESFSFDYDSTNNLYLFFRPSDNSDIQRMLNSDLKTGGIFYVDEDSAGENFYSLLSSGNCWITSFSGLINWAEKSKNLSIKIDKTESGSYEVNIKNNNASDVQNAGIWISVPNMKGRLSISFAGQERELTFDPVKRMYFLTLQSIGGYQEISFRIPADI